jgi:hypothetical protein
MCPEAIPSLWIITVQFADQKRHSLLVPRRTRRGAVLRCAMAIVVATRFDAYMVN